MYAPIASVTEEEVPYSWEEREKDPVEDDNFPSLSAAITSSAPLVRQSKQKKSQKQAASRTRGNQDNGMRAPPGFGGESRTVADDGRVLKVLGRDKEEEDIEMMYGGLGKKKGR